MKLPAFEYTAPSTPAEVVELLAARGGDARVIAGGQSLLPTMAFRLAQPSLLIDLRNLDALRAITINEAGVVLGARTRWCDIEADACLRAAHPLLVEAIGHVAHYQVRNRGTVGGSLAHADPAAELPCIAVTCEAELRLLSPRGERRLGADAFFCGPLTTEMAQDEIILDLRLPPWPPGRRWSFVEFARRAGDFALAGVAVFYDLDAQQRACNVHIGVVGACYYSKRLALAQSAVEGRVVTPEVGRAAGAAAAEEADAPDDLHASATYRKALVAELLEQALREAATR